MNQNTTTTVEASAVLYPSKTGPKPKELVSAEYLGIPVGRDKKVIDPVDVEGLAALGCKDREIANFLGIKEDTLRYNFADQLAKGREQVKINLRRAMIHNATVNHSASVQIFLAKNMLGMSDSPVDSEANAPLPWSTLDD
jgi:hypothetical protein